VGGACGGQRCFLSACTMQASWGLENKAPTPARGAEMYGEVGRYMQSSIESVPWFLTRAEKMAAKNPKKWDAGMSSTSVQKQTTKRPAEMDVVPQGVKVTTGAKPEKMTMADHDHGIVWPPPKGQESSLPFMAMVNKERDGLPVATKDFRGEVNGIMIGYQGHVPRARDKIGSCPLGQVPGRPGAPSLSNDPGYVQSSKAVKGASEPSLYLRGARSAAEEHFQAWPAHPRQHGPQRRLQRRRSAGLRGPRAWLALYGRPIRVLNGGHIWSSRFAGCDGEAVQLASRRAGRVLR